MLISVKTFTLINILFHEKRLYLLVLVFKKNYVWQGMARRINNFY